MSDIESFKKKFNLTNRDAYFLEPFLDEKIEIINLSQAMTNRLNESGLTDGSVFLGAGLISGIIIKLYYRQGNLIFSHDIINDIDSDPEAAIFRDIAAFKTKRRRGHLDTDAN